MSTIRLPLALACVVLLSACDSGGQPSGQVAATVDGTEVTRSQIGVELAASGYGAGGAENAGKDAAGRQALGAIVDRTILAAAARERGLDDTPEGAMALQRASDLALVDLLRQDLLKSVPRPSQDEARQFVKDHPDMFDRRFISVVDQLVVPSVSQPILEKLKPLNDLASIQAVLQAGKVPFQRTMGSVDSLTLDPQVVKAIAALGVGDVYIMPAGAGVRINAVRSREAFPVTGGEAERAAREIVFGQRVNGQTNTLFESILAKGRDKVRYADGFKPSAPAAGKPAR